MENKLYQHDDQNKISALKWNWHCGYDAKVKTCHIFSLPAVPWGGGVTGAGAGLQMTAWCINSTI